MKSLRSRTIQRRGAKSRSRSKARRNNCDNKENNLLTIDLDVAKRIVQEACANAFNTTNEDINGKSIRFKSTFTTGDNNIDNLHHSNAENLFKEFVSSTISKAIASIGPQSKIQSTETSRATKKSRKRPWSVESKVRGVEYAESLHTMCSLFPVMMASDEAKSLQESHGRSISDNSARDVDVTRVNEEPSSFTGYPSSPGSRNTSNNSHHSDHDSLLPPVGAPSTTTTPTRVLGVENTLCTRNSEPPAMKTIPASMQQASQRITDALQNCSSFSAPRSKPSPKKPSEKSDAIGDHDDDCNYDHPLIGVVSDGCYYGGDADSVIHLSKVGSVVLQKTLPADCAMTGFRTQPSRMGGAEEILVANEDL